ALKEDSGQYNVIKNGNDFNVTFRKSQYNDWTYLSMVEIDELNKQSSSIGWLTLFICIMMIIGILIVGFIVSRRLYKPINRLAVTVSDSITDILDHDKHDEFDVIETHMRHMFDQNDQLQSKLQGQIGQL